ncbi:MAG: FxsA family protein [Thermoleophilaceae bacterium]
MIGLIAVFIFVPIAELYVILKIGDAIGWLPTLVLLAADSILGSMLMRSQGRAVWQRFQAAMQSGRAPHREVLDGVLIIFGGAFLITPGFLTDVLGVILLLPPTRALVRRALVRGAGRRFAVYITGAGGAPREYDVEGTAVEHDPPRLDR